MIRILLNKIFNLTGIISVLLFLLIAGFVFAADGSGTMTVSPNSALTNLTGGTFDFTFTAAETINSGDILLNVPSGWSVPQGTSGVAGYTVANSATGTIADALDNADSITGWSAGTQCGDGLTSDTGTKQEGAASINCDSKNENLGDVFYKNIAAQNWSNYTKVAFWIHSSKNLNAGNLQFSYDDNNNLASPIENISVPAITANIWTYVILNFGPTSRTSVISFGFRNNTGGGPLDNSIVRIDDILIGPGVPTFLSGGDINVRILSLSASQTITITYGSGGGASGVSAPSGAGVYTFLTKSRISDAGVLTNIVSSPTITVTSPAPTKFVIIDPTDGTVDAPISVIIQAQNNQGQVATTYNNDVTLVATGTSVTGGGLVDIVNGVGTASISTTVPQTVTLTLSDTQGTGLDVSSTQSVVFSVGATAQLTLNDVSSMTAGTRAAYTATRKDQFGNLVTSGSATFYLYSNATGSYSFFDAETVGNLITSVVISNGTSSANFWYFDQTAGTPTVTVSDNSIVPDGLTGIDDATDQITVTPAAISQFALNDPGNITAGTRAAYTVTRKDQFGNLVTIGSATAYLYTNSSGANAVFYDAASAGNIIISRLISDSQSSANFWYFDDAVGTWTITVSDNAVSSDGSAGIADGTDSITVSQAPIVATRFVISVQSSAAAGNTVPVTISAQDNSSNTDTTFNNGVTLVTSGSATPGGLVTITNGVGSVNITDTVAETVNLSLSDTQGTGLNVSSTAQVIFNPGAVAQFIINDPGAITAGTRAAYTVTRKDQFGNLVTSGALTVYLYSNATGGLSTFHDAASGGNIISSVSIANGLSTVNFWYSEGKAGTWNITTSDNSTSPDVLSGIDDAVDEIIVSPAAVSQFILNNPGDMTAGTRLGYIVTRKDEFNNSVTLGATTVYLYTSSGSASAAFFNAASGGTQITNIIIPNNSSSVNFWYFEEATGTWTVTVSDNATSPDGNTGIKDASDSVTVSAAAIVATRLVIAQPSNSVVNTAVLVTIRAEDNNGNIGTSFNGSATLNVSGSATGGGLINFTNGVATALINDSVAETVVLTLSDTQSTGLNVSSTKTIIFSAVPQVVPVSVGGAAPELLPTTATLVFSGKAFPGATLTIHSIVDGTIPLKESVVSLAKGNFRMRFSGITPGAKSYIIIVTDSARRISLSKTFSFDAKPILIERNITFAPTVGFVRNIVTKGGFLGLNGYGVPGNTVQIEIDGKLISETALVGNDGSWKLNYNTLAFDVGEHIVKAKQINLDGSESDFSLLNTFRAVSTIVREADFNSDGKVTVSDLSIFLSKWESKDKATRLQVDLNHDGETDIKDLSVFLLSLGK